MYFLCCWLVVGHVVINLRLDVAGKKLNRIRKCLTRARRQKIRCREPSRIMQNVLTRVFSKSRKLRRLVRRAVSRNVPKSLYMYIHNYIRFIALHSHSAK